MNVSHLFPLFILKSVVYTALVLSVNFASAQISTASETGMQAGFKNPEEGMEQGVDVVAGSVKPFTAVYRFSHRPSNTLLDEARLRVSPYGIRIDQTVDDTSSTIIANFESDKLWFVDRERKLVHAVPLSFVPGDALDGYTTDDSPMFGFIHYQVCESLSAKYIENIDRHGQLLEHWVCILDEEIVEHQWFDREYGIVVFSLTNDGFVNELVDLRDRQFKPDYFIPPASYRSVSLENILNDVAPIDSYIESTSNR